MADDFDPDAYLADADSAGQAKPLTFTAGPTTVFGLDLDGRRDAQDNGVGAWGHDTANKDIAGVSLPRSVLKEYFGDENKAGGRLVQVVNPANGQQLLLPIVDKGPAPWTGNV